MYRRTFLATAAAFAATPALAAKLSLDEISRYLNGIERATSDFTQVNDDGTLSTGKFYIRRPGRVRFEYNPPEKLLVMAGGGHVGIFDGKSNRRRPRIDRARFRRALSAASHASQPDPGAKREPGAPQHGGGSQL